MQKMFKQFMLAHRSAAARIGLRARDNYPLDE